MIVVDHRNRRGRHRQNHDAVACRCPKQRDEIGRLRNDAPPRPGFGWLVCFRLQRWHAQPGQQARADHRHKSEKQKAADVLRLQQRTTQTAEHRSGERGDDAAS